MGKGEIVAYYRVSTARQGQSGLGLDAQQASVRRYAERDGGSIIGEFIEVETGKGKNALSRRPNLAEALSLCRKRKALLVIAKLDRLARNVFFISGLMESKVDFIAADCPTKDKFRLHLEAAFAEEEARRISIRTKQALAAAKRRGVKLGANGKVLAKKNKTRARKLARSLAPVIRDIREAGSTSVRAIAEELNRRGIPSARGGLWHPKTVHRLLQRLA